MTDKFSLARPGYFIAALFILLPLIDATASVFPMDFGSERWRFGALGTFASVALTPLLGTGLILALALLLDHHRVQRVLGWVCLTFAFLVAIVAILFALDFLQTRSAIAPEYQNAMTTVSLIALLKLTGITLALTFMGLTGIRGPKPTAAHKSKRGDPAETPLLSAR